MFEKLVFGICFYNDPSILRLLDSLPKQAKKIIIDGKFEFNHSKQELSDESLRDKIRLYDNVTLIDIPNVSEPRKRDQYLIDNPYKYLIILDSDEYIVAEDWIRFFDFVETLEDGIHDLFVETDKEGGTSSYPRLWINPSQWRYTMCHNIFKNFNGTVLKSGNTGGKQCPGLLIGTDDDLRNTEYLTYTSEYQGRMIEYEIPFRHKYRDGDMTPFE